MRLVQIVTLLALVTMSHAPGATAGGANPRAARAARTTTLAAPTDVSVLRYRPDLVLGWRHDGHGVAEFEIERATDGGAFTRVGKVGRDARTFRDRNASAAHSYVYRVRAIALGIASPYSLEILATITPARAPHTARSAR